MKASTASGFPARAASGEFADADNFLQLAISWRETNLGMNDPKIVDELKAKHGDVYILTADEAGVQVVCKRPSRPVYRKFRDQRSAPNKRSMAFEEPFLSCLVHPAPKEFDRVLDEMPALADTFGVALWDKVTGAEDASVKKA